MSNQPFPYDEPPHVAAMPEPYADRGKLTVSNSEYTDNLRWLAACGLKIEAVKVVGTGGYEIKYYTPG